MIRRAQFRKLFVYVRQRGLTYLVMRLRFLPILFMVGALGLYILLHTALRDLVVRMLGFQWVGSFLLFENLTLAQALTTLSGLWLIAAAACAAWVIADRFQGERFEWPLVFGLSTFALIAFPCAALGEIAERVGTAYLRPPGGPFLASLPAVGVIALAVFQGWRPHRIRIQLGRPAGLVIFLAVLVSVILYSAVSIALMHPATSGDALSYHLPLSVYLWQDGNLGSFLDRTKALWAFAHPGMVELWFGLLRVTAGEWLANLGQLPFTWLGMLAVYAYSRRLGLGRGAAQLAGLAFPLIPIVALQSVAQPNDLAGAVLFMVAVALACEPVKGWKLGRLALLGVCLGLMATTKLILLPYVFSIGLYLTGAMLWQAYRQQNWQTAAARFGLLAVLFLVTVSPWWVRNIIRYQNPVFPSAIPFIGRGVVIQDMGTIDSAFVPTKLAWPLYPLIEPHDDRSGFGALFIIAAVPGLIFALWRAHRQPLILLLLSVVIMLPAWWLITLHEPRFFLGPVGLSCALIPWALAAAPRSQRRIAGFLLAGTALFSAMVTIDQGLLTLASQPNDRASFYDRVWGVDAYATALPESEPILLHNGFAPTIQEYTAYYPLLGANQSRLVIPMVWEVSAEVIEQTMRSYGIHYVYVTASPEFRSEVLKLYAAPKFELVHQSAIVAGEKNGARRVLYRAAAPNEEDQATWRYLFRLK